MFKDIKDVCNNTTVAEKYEVESVKATCSPLPSGYAVKVDFYNNSTDCTGERLASDQTPKEWKGATRYIYDECYQDPKDDTNWIRCTKTGPAPPDPSPDPTPDPDNKPSNGGDGNLSNTMMFSFATLGLAFTSSLF